METALPFDEWVAAQRELKVLLRRVGMAGLEHLKPMLWRVHRTLAIDCSPTVAAWELKWIADGMKGHPWLRKSALNLANQIHCFPQASTSP